MKRLLLLLDITAAGSSHPSEVNAQANYHATFYGYNPPSATHWLPFADGDSLGTAIYQGHEIPATEGFPPAAYSCTHMWYQHAGQRVGALSGICTMVDDDGDWYQFFFSHSNPDASEGIISCTDGIGRYEGIKCEGTYRGLSDPGSGWFRGEKDGTFVLK